MANALPTTHQPILSKALPFIPAAAESDPPEAVVPLGKVPFKKMVSVPFTVAARTSVELRLVPFPTTLSR